MVMGLLLVLLLFTQSNDGKMMEKLPPKNRSGKHTALIKMVVDARQAGIPLSSEEKIHRKTGKNSLSGLLRHSNILV